MEMMTLLIAGLALSIATNIGMGTVFFTRRTYPGFGCWVAGTACRTLGGCLFLMRGELSPWLTVVLANVLLLSDLALHLRGLLLFRDRPTHPRVEVGLVLSFAALVAWFTFVSPAMDARIVTFAVFSSVLQLWALRVLMTRRPPYFGSGDYLQALTLGLLTLSELTRVLYTVFFAPPAGALLVASPTQLTLILWGLMAILLLALSQIIMNAQRIEYDYRQAQGRMEEDLAERERTAAALRDSETRFRLAFDNANTGMTLVDLGGRMIKVNGRMSSIFGYSRAELEGMSVSTIACPEDARVSEEFIARAMRGELDSFTFEKCYRHRDGHRIHGEVASSLVRDGGGRPLYFISQVQDITERRLAEEALRRSLRDLGCHHAQMVALNAMNERLLACEGRAAAYRIVADSAEGLFGSLAGGLAILRERGDVLEWVASWGDRGGLSEPFPVGDCIALRPQGGGAVSDLDLCRVCAGFAEDSEHGVICVPLTIRDQCLGLLQLLADDGRSQERLSELRTLATTVGESIRWILWNLGLREALREQAIRDPLTGLFNRRYLQETLPRELARCRRLGEPLTLAMLDLDHFKRFNDTYGHEAGDLALSTVGRLVNGWLRASDIACRYGGEELMLILPGTSAAGARERLESLRSAVETTIMPYQGLDLPRISASIGSVEAQPMDLDTDDLIRRADLALYRAKALGRNRVVDFRDSSEPEICLS